MADSYPTESLRGSEWQWVNNRVVYLLGFNRISEEWTASYRSNDGRTEHKATRVNRDQAMKAACFKDETIRKFTKVIDEGKQ